jgi:hypothetical protein
VDTKTAGAQITKAPSTAKIRNAVETTTTNAVRMIPPWVLMKALGEAFVVHFPST